MKIYQCNRTIKRISKLLFVFIFIVNATITHAQTSQLLDWTIPPNYVQFNPNPLTPATLPALVGYTNFPASYASNAMHDASGNIVFFIVDGQVFDNAGRHIGDIMNPNTNTIVEGATEWVIVPVPGECTKYFIIGADYTTPESFGDPRPFYNILDINRPNTNTTQTTTSDPSAQGDFLAHYGTYLSPTDGYNPHQSSMHLAASKLRASGDRFLFISDAFHIYRFKITNTGITYDNYTLVIPTADGSNIERNEMELVLLPDGNYRLALGIFGSDPGGIIPGRIFLGDFNPSGVLIGSGTIIYTPVGGKVRGLEFSADGRYLYASHTAAPYLQYVDLQSSTTLSPLPPFASNPSAPVDFKDSQIELAADGKLYFAGSGLRIACLNSPGTPLTSTWTDNKISNIDVTLCYGPSNLTLGEIRTLPDQIDGENYSIGNLVFSYTAGTYPNTATTQTWTPTSNPFGGTPTNPVGNATNPIIVLNNITIPPGYSITIQGMTFKFKSRTINYASGSPVYNWGGRLIIQNVTGTTGPQVGGRLTLNSNGNVPTILTSDDVCSTPGMWEGVEVWGDQTSVQGIYSGTTAGKQGWLRMYNGSTITKAYIGALAGKKFYNATTTYVYNTPSYGGGVIQTYSNSKFINNQYGVYFMPYNTGNNVSAFNNTEFTTNAALVSADNVKPLYMAYLNDTKGIYFLTSTFTNYAAAYPQTNAATPTYGIRGIHSEFFCVPAVYNLSGPSVGCSFTDFNYGIYATYTNNTKTVTVDYSTFTNNYRGIYLNNAKLVPTIIRNNFNIIAFNASTASLRAYGLYLNACTSYKIEENDFTTVGTTSVNDIGIIVNNSGDQHNEIYKNNFHQVFAGIQAQSINCDQTGIDPDPRNIIGLQNLCNTFSTIKDMDMGITSGCIDWHQGKNLVPAGNKFSHSNNTSYNDYYTYSQSNDLAFIGYISNTDYAQTPQTGRYTPPPAIIIGNNGLAFDPNTQCLSHFIKIKAAGTDPQSQINTYKTKIAEQMAMLDAGKDVTLITAINSNMNSINLKTLLQNKSPYLSDEVLIAYITKNGVSNNNKKDIIISNSPVTQAVKDVLNSISLSSNIRNQINAAQTGTSQRRNAADLILYYQDQISQKKNDIIREYVNDASLDHNIDGIISKINSFEGAEPSADKKEILADLYTEKGDYAMAEALLSQLEFNPEKQNLVKIKRVNKSLKQNNQSFYALQTDAVNKQIVEEVAADNSTQGSELAIGILQQVFDEEYQEPIEELDRSHRYTSIIGQETNEAIKLSSIYPNPNNGLMQLDYSLNEGETGELRIFDITGRLVVQYNLDPNESTLPINQTILNNGVYLYQVLTNGKIVNSDKLILVKEY